MAWQWPRDALSWSSTLLPSHFLSLCGGKIIDKSSTVTLKPKTVPHKVTMPEYMKINGNRSKYENIFITHPATVRHWSSAAIRTGWLVGMRCFNANILFDPSVICASAKYTELKVPVMTIKDLKGLPISRRKTKSVISVHSKISYSIQAARNIMANLLQFYLWYEKFETAAAELHTGMQCLSQHPLNKRESGRFNYFYKQL